MFVLMCMQQIEKMQTKSKIMFLSHFRAVRSPHNKVHRICIGDNSNKKPEKYYIFQFLKIIREQLSKFDLFFPFENRTKQGLMTEL